MDKIYVLNNSSKVLHIKGFCSNSYSGFPSIEYVTEQEAICANGRFIRMCKNCQEKKEGILQKAVRERI
mgnify:CR=1 FL=1